MAPLLPATRRRGRSYAPLAVLAALLLAGLLAASAFLGLRDEPTAPESSPLAITTGTEETPTAPVVVVPSTPVAPETDAEPDNSPDEPDNSPDPGPDNTGSPEPAETEAEPEPTNTSNPNTGAQPRVPAGFDIYQDETGFSLAIPTGWQVSTEGPRRIFKEPGTGRFLMVDQTDTPRDDPVEDWEEQAASISLPGYNTIRVDPAEWRNWEAADWEFTWESDDGPRHVLNRNVITEPGEQAYALYWSTPESEWDASLATFEVFERTFRPVQ